MNILDFKKMNILFEWIFWILKKWMPFWMNILDFKKDNCLLFLDRIWTFIAGQRWITSQVDDGYVVISEAVLTWMHLACSQWSNSQSWRFWGRSANDMWRRVHWRARIVLWAKSLRHHHRQRKGYINKVIQFSKWVSGVQQILVQCYITCLSCIFGVHRWKDRFLFNWPKWWMGWI